MNEQDRDTRMNKIESKLSQIYAALLGSELSKDGGLIKRVIIIETQIGILENEFKKQIEKEMQTSLYVKIIWAMGGVIGSGIVAIIVAIILKRI